MGLLEILKDFRKRGADAVLNNVSMHADEATRLGMWLCFGASVALLLNALFWALMLLIGGLIFDVVDGAMARRQGLDRPEVDWAADRYTEFVIFSALIYRRPGPLSLGFFLLFLLNVFLPVKRIPVLPLRQALAVYLGALFVTGK